MTIHEPLRVGRENPNYNQVTPCYSVVFGAQFLVPSGGREVSRHDKGDYINSIVYRCPV